MAVLVFGLVSLLTADASAADRVDELFRARIQPILNKYCVSCHANGTKTGGLTLEDSTWDPARLRDGPFWWTVLKHVRAGTMPPTGNTRLPDAERLVLEDWIKCGPFGIEPTNSDPGRVTVRRLNRIEYRNTIRDLMGVDYDTQAEFPPDDSGHGFDNIADVLTLSPLLMEKYLVAAKSIVSQAVPMVPRVVAETKIVGQSFHQAFAGKDENAVDHETDDEGSLSLSYYKPALVNEYVSRGAPRPVQTGP